MKNWKQITRRNFLQYSGLVMGGCVAAPAIVPSSVFGRNHSSPNDRITMGFIGMGTMGNGHLFGEAWTYLPGGYLAREDVQVLGVCDVWRDRRENSKKKVDEFYSQKFGEGSYQSCKAFRDFRDLLAVDEIDAVLIATPIHWHATMAVMAAEAGKDIYCEKPTAVTIHESQAVVEAVRKNNRVFQAGTQQRSEYDGKFRRACEMIRSGCVGELKHIYAYRDGGGVNWPDGSGDVVPVPDHLDWDLWLGPAPKITYQGRSDAHLFGFGGINWGQHHYDIVQWALDADRTGPVEVYLDNGSAAYRYANGVVVYGRPYQDKKIGETGGGWYIGSEGKIAVDREHLVSKPASIVKKPLGPDDVHLYKSESHSGNFLECVRTRKRTICDVETAHRAVSVLLLGGIVQKVKRSLKWDPINECFIDDDEANELLTIPKREPWVV